MSNDEHIIYYLVTGFSLCVSFSITYYLDKKYERGIRKKRQEMFALPIVGVVFGGFCATMFRWIAGMSSEWTVGSIFLTIGMQLGMVVLLDYYFVIKGHSVF